MLIFVEHLVFTLRHRTTDNQWRTGIIYQNGIHLIDNGVVMSPLYQIERRGSHIITQVVETELIVRTESNIARVCTAALIAVGAILIDAINRQAVEHIKRAHPLGVTLGEIVVHGNHMHALVGQRIEEDGQRCHQRLTLTGCHLGNFALVKHHATNQLHIIVHHIPANLIAARSPRSVIHSLVAVNIHKVVATIGSEVLVLLRRRYHNRFILGKTTSRRFHNGKGFGQHLVEHRLIVLFYLLLEFVYLRIDFLALVYLKRLDTCSQVSNSLFLIRYTKAYLLHQRGTAST